MTKPLLIAHRGDTRHFPENTLEAFSSAFQKGADGIELDVHLDIHNQVIIVHNYLHDKSRNYPLLSDVCDHFKNSGLLEIEIKSFDPRCLEAVKVILDDHQVKNFKLTTSIQPLLPHMRSLFANADIGIIFRRWLLEEWMSDNFISEWTTAHLKLSGANYLHLDLDQWSDKLSHDLRSQGYKLHSHLKTASLDDYQRTVDLGLDTCTFDDSAVLQII